MHQYELLYNSQTRQFEVKLVRQFGRFEGSTEIEAIAVDNELGYIYYSDEGYGIRKYDADPASGNTELALFGLDNFIEDREGIAIYSTSDSTGYLIVSDQQAGQVHLYLREGTPENPDHHPLIKEIPYQAMETDGIEVTSVALNNKFPEGMLVAMSETKNFELYSWKQISGLLNP